MYAAEQEGLFLIVAMLGKSHPSVAVIQPLLDKYETDNRTVYDGRSPEAEARAIREALVLIQDAGTDMPNVQERLRYLDDKTVFAPQEPVDAPTETVDEPKPPAVSYEDIETEIDNGS